MSNIFAFQKYLQKKNKNKKELKNKKMEIKEAEERRIDNSLRKKVDIKAIFGCTVIFSFSWLFVILILRLVQLDPDIGYVSPAFLQSLNLQLLFYIVIIPTVVILVLNDVYIQYYLKNFSYRMRSSHLEIKHGIWTKNRATIPFSRIQNINIVNGLFDRIFGLYTVKIETAGGSAYTQAAKGYGKPEGYIPGIKDPFTFEKELKQMLDKYNVLPSGLEDKIFKPQELAFDNFISYVLTKLRDKDDLLKNSIKELRENQNLSMLDLAEKVGVKKETIEQLESGRYTPSLSLAYKIAKELKVRIEDLFKF